MLQKQPPRGILSKKKVFWKYATNLQENTHAEVWFQWSCKAIMQCYDIMMNVMMSVVVVIVEKWLWNSIKLKMILRMTKLLKD